VCGQSCATPTPDRRGLGALLGQLVDPAPPTSCGRPAALDQASLLEPVKRWVKRSFKDIKLAAAAVMQFLDDRVSMAREEDLLSRPRRVCSSTRGQNYVCGGGDDRMGHAACARKPCRARRVAAFEWPILGPNPAVARTAALCIAVAGSRNRRFNLTV
jgi:hypothetical protein